MKAVWSPGYFGVNFAISVTGSNTTPPPPPTTPGTPSAGVANIPYNILKVAA